MKPGHVIAGRYRLERMAGRGGMGIVWQARHTELGTTLAVKVLMAGAESDPRTLRRFRREARAAAALRCPHVVDVRDYGLDGGAPYIVMEFLEGESLASRLTRTPGPQLAELSEWIAQAAIALDYAHARGFLHRDVKPSNLFLSRAASTCVLKVLDFGIVKSLHEADGAESTMVGSPGYLSPEQARGEGLDHTTDLWSLGAVTYRAVTGVEPFAAAGLAEVVERVCVRPVPLASALMPSLPPGIDAFFERALCRERSGRFRSGAELAAALAAVARHAPLLELPSSVSDQPGTGPAPRIDTTQSWASFTTRRHSQVPDAPGFRPSATRNGWLLAGALFCLGVVAVAVVGGRVENQEPTPPVLVWKNQAAAVPPVDSASGVQRQEPAAPSAAISAGGPVLSGPAPAIRSSTAARRRTPVSAASTAPLASGAKDAALPSAPLDPTFGLPFGTPKEADEGRHGAITRALDAD